MSDEKIKQPAGHESVNVLKPDEKGKGIEKPVKKGHGVRTFLIVLLVVIVGLLIAVSATGVYAVPGISAIFGMNKPKDLGIKTSEAALASLKTKIPIEITGDRVDYANVAPTDIFSGTIPADSETTSEEITSWLNRQNQGNPPITDLQVKYITGGMEISGMLNYKIKAPVYVKVMESMTSSKSISLDLQEAKVGAFKVPEKYYSQIEDWVAERINAGMEKIPGFSMESQVFYDGYSYFKGTYPASVKGLSGGWSSLVDYGI